MATYFKFLLIAFTAYYLSACKSPQSIPNKQEVTINPEVQQQVKPDELSEIQIIARDFANTQDIDTLNTQLLNLADEAISQQNCNKANIIVKHIQPSLNNDLLQVAKLFKAECNFIKLSSLSDAANKAPILKQTERWLDSLQIQSLLNFEVNDSNANLIERKIILQARFNAITGQHAIAINQLLQLPNNQRFFDKSYFGSTLWEWFTYLDTNSRSELVTKFPNLVNYKILIETIEDESINDSMRKVVINNWINSQQVNELELPDQILNYMSLSADETKKIAVLLPLSGRLASQGEAIRHGLLSAYFNKLDNINIKNEEFLASIEFIDTGSFDSLTPGITAEKLAAYDTIIGPLLRSHINQFNDMFLESKKTLLLNRSSIINAELNSSTNLIGSLSLSPEQEASQIVSLMREQNIRNPILVSDNSNVSKRMVEAFLQSWRNSELNIQDYIAPQIVFYTDNKGMKVGITSALDVLQSEKRIQQVSNLTQERVISVTRNRRDVDSFVVFARPNDVELINPIIESSISLFSNEQIPVFASSYGYDHKQSKNTQRDLKNLVFIDMPWLLPKERISPLAEEVDQLFNNPPSTFLRLFAFGYDSLSIAENLAKLTTFKHIHHNGLSGRLSSNSNNQFIRQLDFIEIENN